MAKSFFYREIFDIYRKVASSSLSRLVAQFQIFRRLMKEKFDAYVLWPLAKRFQNWIVDRSTARDFTVYVTWFLRIRYLYLILIFQIRIETLNSSKYCCNLTTVAEEMFWVGHTKTRKLKVKHKSFNNTILAFLTLQISCPCTGSGTCTYLP